MFGFNLIEFVILCVLIGILFACVRIIIRWLIK